MFNVFVIIPCAYQCIIVCVVIYLSFVIKCVKKIIGED